MGWLQCIEWPGWEKFWSSRHIAGCTNLGASVSKMSRYGGGGRVAFSWASAFWCSFFSSRKAFISSAIWSFNLVIELVDDSSMLLSESRKSGRGSRYDRVTGCSCIKPDQAGRYTRIVKKGRKRIGSCKSSKKRWNWWVCVNCSKSGVSCQFAQTVKKIKKLDGCANCQKWGGEVGLREPSKISRKWWVHANYSKVEKFDVEKVKETGVCTDGLKAGFKFFRIGFGHSADRTR